MAGCGDVTEHLEGTGAVALDVGDCDEEDPDGGGGFVGAGSRGPADDALQVCALKIPASAIGGPDL